MNKTTTIFLSAIMLGLGATIGVQYTRRTMQQTLNQANAKIAEMQQSVPEQLVPMGFVFDVNGQEGTIKVTVDSTELIRDYHLTGSDGNEGRMTQETLVEGLKSIGLWPPTK